MGFSHHGWVLGLPVLQVGSHSLFSWCVLGSPFRVHVLVGSPSPSQGLFWGHQPLSGRVLGSLCRVYILLGSPSPSHCWVGLGSPPTSVPQCEGWRWTWGLLTVGGFWGHQHHQGPSQFPVELSDVPTPWPCPHSPGDFPRPPLGPPGPAAVAPLHPAGPNPARLPLWLSPGFGAGNPQPAGSEPPGGFGVTPERGRPTPGVSPPHLSQVLGYNRRTFGTVSQRLVISVTPAPGRAPQKLPLGWVKGNPNGEGA